DPTRARLPAFSDGTQGWSEQLVVHLERRHPRRHGRLDHPPRSHPIALQQAIGQTFVPGGGSPRHGRSSVATVTSQAIEVRRCHKPSSTAAVRRQHPETYPPVHSHVV